MPGILFFEGTFEKGPDGPFSEVDYAGTTLLACGPF